MIYLKLFSQRLIKDKEVIENIKQLNSDKEIIDYLKSLDYDLTAIIKAFENHYAIEYVDLGKIDIDEKVIGKFNKDKLRETSLLPYDYSNGRFYFVSNKILREDNFSLLGELTDKDDIDVEFKFAFKHEIEDRMNLLFGLEEPTEEIGEDFIAKEDFDEDFKVQRWVNRILNKGINFDASDIHVESRSGGIQVRYRIDGVLSRKEFHKLTDKEVSNVIVRFKLIAGMDISEKRKPQDGRIAQYLLNENDYDFRVSCVNTNMGEKIVLRIFNRTEKIMSFKELGFLEEDIIKIERALNNKSGVIYVAGATGAGKTTTLYSMIDHLNSEEVNIYTIEDPIEKEIKNVNQIQIDPLAGITFPSTLKSLLRQDPDIIVVGEVRDRETANLSISASLTGHLVISTMHANNAIDSISRLFEMEIEPFLLGTSSVLFMSQKLVRKLCPHCKERVNELDNLEKIWLKNKFDKDEIDGLTENNNIYRPIGCDECSGGFKGRLAIGEFFEVSKKAREFISQKKPINEIEQLAFDEGYKTLEMIGMEKVLSGETSIDELIRQLG